MDSKPSMEDEIAAVSEIASQVQRWGDDAPSEGQVAGRVASALEAIAMRIQALETRLDSKLHVPEV